MKIVIGQLGTSIVLVATMLASVPAQAAPTRIVCKADRHYYNSRQGNVDESTGTMVFDLDDATQPVTVENGPMMPDPTGQSTQQVTRYDSTEIDFQVRHTDAPGYWSQYTASINRLTGEFTFLVTTNAPHPSYFTGTCTKAVQQF
jgi:hypothetical protein